MASLSSNPIVLAILGGAFAIGAIAGIGKLSDAFDNSAEKAELFNTSVENLNKTLSEIEQIKSLDDSLETFEDLAGKINLTTEEENSLTKAMGDLSSASETANKIIMLFKDGQISAKDAVALLNTE